MFSKLMACFITGLIFLIDISLLAQDQKLADSLIHAYKEGNYKDELQVLQEIAEYESDPNVALTYSVLLIEKALTQSNHLYAHSGYLQKGNHLQSLGNYIEALQAYFKSEEHAALAGDELGKAGVLIAIADTYSEMGNSSNAKSYYRKGLKEVRQINDSVVLATTLLNAGDEYLKTKNYDTAMQYFKESGIIFKILDVPIGLAYNFGNSGMVYAETGNDSLAEKNIMQAIVILEELEDYHPIAVYLTYLSDIYLRKNDIEKAFSYAEQSLNLSRQQNLKKEISEAHLKLAELNKTVGDYEKAYGHFEDHILYRDSIRNIEAVQEMARLRTENEVAKKQTEVDLLEQKEKTQSAIVVATGIGMLFIGLIAFGLYRRNKFISRTKSIIEKERNRSDRLLQNILPEETALELKNSGKVKSKRFDSVSVLFGDFVGFTRYSERLSPEELVDCVDFYFSKFDEIVEKYGLEKIKTLGDCYMCAGGLPFPVKDHAQRLTLAAFEMQEFVSTFKAKSELASERIKFNIKIGINSGPVVAGVVGTKKFAYDIWGDTVNIASRMESHSEPGQINISESTYKLIDHNFICEHRGEIEVKNKGLMRMYYVKGIKEHARKMIDFKEPLLENK
ncbi:hypothetical protein GCM10023115_52100 [Pontixanthobacter gangjinensis]|uniref:Adenylate cyclase n=1 Tax=Christiangramia aestuarii TaxID=1028746 RepID=A0A7K1LQQ3_9FLAO|nr:adenylate/guanylate cyclase domain-containing protein [Christiangramia aestuarii]MUP42790.1 adenylate/guanylate cyclase domain-containing protein [Christiangramia aestuarii]